MKKISAIILTISILFCSGCAIENKTVEPTYTQNYVEVYTDLNDNTVKLNPQTKTFEFETYGGQYSSHGAYEDKGDCIVLYSDPDIGTYQTFSKQGDRLRYDAYRSTGPSSSTMFEGASFQRR